MPQIDPFEADKKLGALLDRARKKLPPMPKRPLSEFRFRENRAGDVASLVGEFAFTKLMVCGYCASGITAEEKYKRLRDGTTAKYVYYGCTRGKDRHCKNTYIREKALIKELLKIIDKVKIDQLGMRFKLEEEVKRYNAFQMSVLGDEKERNVEPKKLDVRTYAKYLLKHGSIIEKRELLAFLQSKIIYERRKVRLLED